MVTKQKILVTGSNGQLGKELQAIAAKYRQYDFIFLTREDFAIDDPQSVKNVFAKYTPQFVINCAAYTAVDKAEQEKKSAFKINGEAVGVLAGFCKKNNSQFIHISTDYVFDGTATVPYEENAVTNPQGVYGASKLEGERLAFQSDPDAVIIRTSWVYSEFGKNFVKTILRLLKEKEEINVVNDQYGSPTCAADLAETIMKIVTSQTWQPGIYHYSNDGIINWFEFAEQIKKISGSSCKINPVPTSAYPAPAKRPLYSALNKTKIQQAYNIELKFWKDSLAECFQKITSSSNQ